MKMLRQLIWEQVQAKPVRMPLSLPIPEDLRSITSMFNTAGQELYIVGGAVRDVLMNKTPKDYDLATGASPEAVMEILDQNPELRVDLTGKAFGVVRVKTPAGEEYEIATFRKDIGKGRRPDAVEFTSIEDDVKRRDLTINALFYDLEAGEVVDYVGGIEDIENKVVRAVGDPAERFDEDKLRILRAVRFAGRMGSELDPGTEQAILDDNELTEVTPERIRDEFIKGIQSAQDVQRFFGMLEKLGLFDQILPSLSVNTTTGSSSKDALVQVALLTRGDAAVAEKVLKSMRYTNDEVSGSKFLHQLDTLTKESAPALKKEINRLRLEDGQVKEYLTASGVLPPRAIDAFLEFAKAPPSVSARELMDQGLKGPEIGRAMNNAESEAYAQMLGEIRRYIRKVLRSSRKR